jgi:hypothetical protein
MRRRRAPRESATHIVNVKVELRSARFIAIAKGSIMLRQHLVRSLKRPALRAALNGSRAFTASAPRPAEVELTIGLCRRPLPPTMHANGLRRWQEGVD